MRIALVLERFDPATGGQAIWTRGFAAHLREAGHEVHVLACDGGGPDPPARVHEVPWAWAPLARAARFDRALAALRPNAVHDSGAASWPGLFQPQTGSGLHSLDRLIATEPPARRLRAALSPKMIWLRRQMAMLEGRQARRARRIVAVSSLVRDLLAARHPEAAGRIALAPNGVDTAFFAPAGPGLREAERARLGLSGETLFLAAAHNLRLKGLDTALRALARLAGTGEPVRLAVAGGLPDPPWLRLVAGLGLEGRVMFLGQVADMRPLYAAADALLHPTRWDACSLVVLEALASGLPVVTTGANGAADAVAAGRSGFVVADPEDAGAVAEAMRALLDPDLRRRLGAEARRSALGRDLGANYRAVERLLVESAAP